MNLKSQIELQASGTSEGVTKAWDTRGRRAQQIVEQAGYQAVTHRMETSKPGIRLAEPNHITTFNHPLGKRITIYKGPTSSNSWAHRNERGKLSSGKTREIGKLKQAVGLSLEAYGTSEGIEKAWDTRGRGRKVSEMTQREFVRHVSSLAPRFGGWSADIYQGDKELLMPPQYTKFPIEGRDYSWHLSSHKIRGRSMAMSNNLFVVGPDGLVGKFSMGTVGSEKQAIVAALHAILQDVRKAGLKAQAAGGQTDSSSFIGRKLRVVDTRYGHAISEHDNPEDAERAARARPYSKVVSWPRPENSQKLRDMARARAVKTNPDID